MLNDGGIGAAGAPDGSLVTWFSWRRGTWPNFRPSGLCRNFGKVVRGGTFPRSGWKSRAGSRNFVVRYDKVYRFSGERPWPLQTGTGTIWGAWGAMGGEVAAPP